MLVVEDDETVREVLRRYLADAGHDVVESADGAGGLRLALDLLPDVVVLDLMLPGRDGLEVCRELRARRPQTPILVLTALGEEEDRIRGLRYGADDYVTKPFSPRELVLRVGSVLRRASPAEAVRVVDGDLVLDRAGRTASLGGVTLGLTGREFDLLEYLVAHPGRAFTRPELLAEVWGWEFGDQSTVTVHVRRLREKLEEDPTRPRRIATVWGTGYRYDRAAPAGAGSTPC